MVKPKTPEAPEIQKSISAGEALKRVRHKKMLYTAASTTTGAVSLALGMFASTGLLLLGPTLNAVTILNKYARIEKVIELFQSEFGESEIQILSDLEMEGGDDPDREYDRIDLYIRFPKKTQIFITVRSMGKNTVAYNEVSETLLIKRSRGRTSEVQPCPILGLNQNKQWLTKNRKAFDLSSNAVFKTATAKVLVIWNETKLANHRQELYSDIGKGKYLTLFKEGTKTFVVEQERLADFVRDWLTHLEK